MCSQAAFRPASRSNLRCALRAAAVAAVPAFVTPAHADAITDWNAKAADLIAEARPGSPPAYRMMAIVQTAALAASTRAAGAGARGNPVAASPAANATGATAATEAAIAAAHRGTLLKLVPAQQPAIDAAYQAALQSIADGPAKLAGIALGEKAATDVLAARLEDGAAAPDTHRPRTTAGAYLPTPPMVVPQWPQRKPWLLTSAAQFRPGPPPALTSDAWAQDYNEVKAVGARQSTYRSAEHTDAARFWDYSLPPIYFGVVRSVAAQPGRDLLRNARLYAAVAQALDDALISVFDAKYHHCFWRPATAIRNGDVDDNDSTERDAGWAPLIDAPMHPEYPSAHSILASALATVLKAEIGAAPMPTLATSSPTAKGATRRWTSLDSLVDEVSNARIWGGIHYRSATDTGTAMGRQVGALAVSKVLNAAP